MNTDYRGSFKIFRNFRDSIILNEKDEKFISIYFKVIHEDEPKREIKQTECDSFFGYTQNPEDTLKTHFYIKPQKKGKNYIFGYGKEQIFLTSYPKNDTAKSRLIESTIGFHEEFYVK